MSGFNIYYPETERPKLRYLVALRGDPSPSYTLRALVEEDIKRKQEEK